MITIKKNRHRIRKLKTDRYVKMQPTPETDDPTPTPKMESPFHSILIDSEQSSPQVLAFVPRESPRAHRQPRELIDERFNLLDQKAINKQNAFFLNLLTPDYQKLSWERSQPSSLLELNAKLFHLRLLGLGKHVHDLLKYQQSTLQFSIRKNPKILNKCTTITPKQVTLSDLQLQRLCGRSCREFERSKRFLEILKEGKCMFDHLSINFCFGLDFELAGLDTNVSVHLKSYPRDKLSRIIDTMPLFGQSIQPGLTTMRKFALETKLILKQFNVEDTLNLSINEQSQEDSASSVMCLSKRLELISSSDEEITHLAEVNHTFTLFDNTILDLSELSICKGPQICSQSQLENLNLHDKRIRIDKHFLKLISMSPSIPEVMPAVLSPEYRSSKQWMSEIVGALSKGPCSIETLRERLGEQKGKGLGYHQVFMYTMHLRNTEKISMAKGKGELLVSISRH